MREEIGLYRGKRKDNGKWVYGYLGVFKGIWQIYVPFTEEEEKANEGHFFSAIGGLWYIVLPETVGEHTGLTDKNGKRIFEGDIVEGKFDGLYIILWYPRNAQFIKFSGYDRVPWTDIESMTRQNLINPLLQKDMCSDLKVIGNVIDNPELLQNT